MQVAAALRWALEERKAQSEGDGKQGAGEATLAPWAVEGSSGQLVISGHRTTQRVLNIEPQLFRKGLRIDLPVRLQRGVCVCVCVKLEEDT